MPARPSDRESSLFAGQELNIAQHARRQAARHDDSTPRFAQAEQVPKDDKRIKGEIVELPSSWALDDWPYFEPGDNGRDGMSAPSRVLEIWTGELRYALEGSAFIAGALASIDYDQPSCHQSLYALTRSLLI